MSESMSCFRDQCVRGSRVSVLIFKVGLLDLVQKVLQLSDVLGELALAAEAGSGCQIKTTASYPSDNVAWLEDALSGAL